MPTTLFGSGGDASYQTYCRAVGLALSPALTDQERASSILGRWLQLTNTAAVWSGGLLRFIPYGDSSVSGNGITFNPNVTPIYNLGDDDFKVENNEDPLQVSRSDPYEAYNVWRLEIAERGNAYNLTSVESRDQNAIELYGMRIASTVTAHEICDPNIALISGQLILQRALYIRNTYKFRLSWEYCLLDPMDLVTVTDSLLGLSNAPIRITEIEEDENGFLSVTAEEFPLGAATATLYPTQPVTNDPINRNVAADPVNTPIIFEPPSALVGATAQVWIAASGGSGGVADPNWGGANIWLSIDGTTYNQIGQIVGPARQGVLSSSLPSFTGANPDTADTLALNMAESGGVLATATDLDAQLANTLCIVDSELVSYATATLTSANHYSLTYLYRGLYGTAIASHSSGAPFARLDSTVFEYDLPAQYVGKTLYIKLQIVQCLRRRRAGPFDLHRLHLHADRHRSRSSSGARDAGGCLHGFRPGHAIGRHAGRLRRAVHPASRIERGSRSGLGEPSNDYRCPSPISARHGLANCRPSPARRARWPLTRRITASSSRMERPRAASPRRSSRKRKRSAGPPFRDANYSAATTDRSIAYTALTAARTVTLPAASSFPAGCQLTITDETGNCSATKSITVARAGTDTIDGATSAVLAAAYAGLVLKCNGSNQWTILAQTSPPQLNTVAQGPNGSQIQFGVLEQLITLSGSSTTSTIQIPNRAIVFAVSELVVTAVTGAPSFGVGVSGNTTQFGGSLGTSAGSNNTGVIGPTAFYSATSIVITATSGSFTGGTVRISIQYMLCNVPTS